MKGQIIDSDELIGKTITHVMFGTDLPTIFAFSDDTFVLLTFSHDDDSIFVEQEIELEKYVLHYSKKVLVPMLMSEKEYNEWLKQEREKLKAAEEHHARATYEKLKARFEPKAP